MQISARLAFLDSHWAIYQPAAESLSERVEQLMSDAELVKLGYENMQQEVKAATTSESVDEKPKPYQIVGKTAVLNMSGPMTKNPSCMSLFVRGASTVLTRKALMAAAKDEDVNAICMVMDSPGGQVSGTGDLAATIERVRGKKPVYAYAEDMCASAAYWVASSCDAVFCNPTAMVGSIGTYMVLHDTSRMAENMGVQVHVVKAGKMKGAGTGGTPISGSQLHDFQRVVNQLNDQFTSSVAKNRRYSKSDMEKMADGRVHVGKEALKMGLVDGVCALDDCLQHLSQYAAAMSTYGDRLMMHQAHYNHATGTLIEGPARNHDTEQPSHISQSGAGGSDPMPTLWDKFKAVLGGVEVDDDGQAPSNALAPAQFIAPVAAAKNEEMDELKAQISTLVSTVNAQSGLIENLKADNEKSKAESLESKGQSRIASAIREGYLTKASGDKLAGLIESGNFDALNAALDAIEAGPKIPVFEGASNKTVDSKDLLASYGTDPQAELDNLVAAKMESARKSGEFMDYTQAYVAVTAANPELAMRIRDEENAKAVQV